MAKLMIGPSLDDARLRVETAIDAHYREYRLRQGYYAGKVLEAHRVVAGERSSLIEREAKLRNVEPGALAEGVLMRAQGDEDAELDRVRLKDKVRKAAGLTRIRALVKSLGIEV